MKLPADAIVPDEKLQKYLLVPREENDKSCFLALAGYSLANWKTLRKDLLTLAQTYPIRLSETTVFGTKYVVSGTLVGPNGYELHIITIWMTLKATAETRFITLYPDQTYQRREAD
jgi:hypothetical protein